MSSTGTIPTLLIACAVFCVPCVRSTHAAAGDVELHQLVIETIPGKVDPRNPDKKEFKRSFQRHILRIRGAMARQEFIIADPLNPGKTIVTGTNIIRVDGQKIWKLSPGSQKADLILFSQLEDKKAKKKRQITKLRLEANRRKDPEFKSKRMLKYLEKYEMTLDDVLGNGRKIIVKRTIEVKTIAGLKCVKLLAKENDVEVAYAWVAENIPVSKDFLHVLELAGVIDESMHTALTEHKGLPLMLWMRSPSGREIEVITTKAATGLDLNKSLFQLPDGYKEVKMKTPRL